MKKPIMYSVAVASCAVLGGLAALAGPATAQGTTTQTVAAQATAATTPSPQDLEFKYSLNDFLRVRALEPHLYDFKSDKCSVPKSIHIGSISGKKIIDAYFTDQCERHDFGYRNNRLFPVGPPSTQWETRADLRAAIDKKLHSDMDARCSKYSHLNPLREPCFAASDVVYKAVRLFGASSFR